MARTLKASELTEIPGVESVNSILDVPLLSQSGGSLTELAGNFRTLRDPDIDFDRARMELINSPVFSELVVSVDGICWWQHRASQYGSQYSGTGMILQCRYCLDVRAH